MSHPQENSSSPAPEAQGISSLPQPKLDNKSVASIFYELADLMEINGDDPFRIRSYRRAAEAIEALTEPVSTLIQEPKRLLAVPGIGKAMCAHLQELLREGRLRLHSELLEKYRPSMLELLKIQGLGPKTIALLWSAYKVSDLAGVEQLAREGKIRTLPRMGEKQEQKILKSIEQYRQIAGRFYLDDAEQIAEKLCSRLRAVPGVERAIPVGSLRRGRETVGDLDILVTGSFDQSTEARERVQDAVVNLPGVLEVLSRGDNKVSLKLRSRMQVDVRLLPPESFGAAMQYFTGSKQHNVALRQRALRMGYTLSEYALARVDDHTVVAGASEAEIYGALGLDYIEPELRENCGELEAAAAHRLPRLIQESDIQGDVHMHTIETDGRATIQEMAEAAHRRGYRYLAITDHSKNLAFANGLDDSRAVEHARRIRAANQDIPGIRIFAGIEVDILSDGRLDLSDTVLEELDVVIASVHSYFQQEPAEMTDRLLRALENPHVSILGHPTGRILLRREGYQFDLDAVLQAAAKNHIALEHNAYPDRLDLSDRHLRLARQHGARIVINTDAHHPSHLEKIRYGISQLRRAWLEKQDVLNTLPPENFAEAMKRRYNFPPAS